MSVLFSKVSKDADWGTMDFPCPTCGATLYDPCHTASGKKCEFHSSRIEEAIRRDELEDRVADEVEVIEKDLVKGFLLKRGRRQAWISATRVFKNGRVGDVADVALGFDYPKHARPGRLWHKIRAKARKLMMTK